MVTFLIYAFGLLVVGGLLFLVVSLLFGRGEELSAAPQDSTPLELPEDRPVTAEDLRAVRMPVVFRGYRMTEVDWLVEELATALEDRDRELMRLRARLEARPDPSGPVDHDPIHPARHVRNDAEPN